MRLVNDDFVENPGPPPWLAWTFIGVVVLAIAAVLWLVGCGPAEAAWSCGPAQKPAVVDRIVDGDTILVSGILFSRIVGEQVRIDLVGWGKVRLVGVDSPERGQPGFLEAKLWMEKRLTAGETVCLEGGIGLETFGRWLTTVYDNDGNVNDAIVAAGLAAGTIGPKP